MPTPTTEIVQNDLELAIYNLEQARHCSVTNGKRGLMIVSELLASAVAKSKGFLYRELKMVHEKIQKLMHHADNEWDLVRRKMLYLKVALQSIHSFNLSIPEVEALAMA